MNWLLSCCRRNCCCCCRSSSSVVYPQQLTIIPNAEPRQDHVEELASCKVLEYPKDDVKLDLPTAKKLIASIPDKVAISPSNISQTKQVYYLNQEMKSDVRSLPIKEIIEGLNFAQEKNKRLANLCAIVFDRSLTARAISKPTCELFDCGPQDLLGHTLPDLFQNEERTAKTIAERVIEIDKLLKNARPSFNPDSIQLKKTKKDVKLSEDSKEITLHHYTLSQIKQHVFCKI